MSRVPAHQVMPVAGLTPAQKHRAVRTFFAHLSEKDDGGRHAGDVLGYCDTIFDYHLYNLSSTSVAERRRMRQATIKAVTQEHAVSLWVELEVGWYFESQHNPRARRLQQGRALFRRLLVPSVGFSLPLLGGSTDNPLAGIAQPITLRRPPNQTDHRKAKYEFLDGHGKPFYCYGECQLRLQDNSDQWVIGPPVAALDTFSHVRFNGVCPLKQGELLAELFPSEVGLIILRMALDAEVAPAKVRTAKRRRL